MMEKPLAVSMEHARAMESAAKKGGIQLVVNYETTWYPANHAAYSLVHETNAALYETPFLTAVHALLTPGGALVVWSAGRAPDLAEAMRSVFHEVSEQSHEVRLQDRDEEYWLYAAHRN